MVFGYFGCVGKIHLMYNTGEKLSCFSRMYIACLYKRVLNRAPLDGTFWFSADKSILIPMHEYTGKYNVACLRKNDESCIGRQLNYPLFSLNQWYIHLSISVMITFYAVNPQ